MGKQFNNNKHHIIVCLLWVALSSLLIADEPQSTIKEGVQYILFDPHDGFQMSLSTSQAPTPKCTGDATQGPATYVWDFGKLHGVDNGDGTATIFSDVAGDVDISVYCKQTFQSSDSSSTYAEQTQTSDKTMEHVQEPSTMQPGSPAYSVAGNNCQAIYYYQVLDQDGYVCRNDLTGYTLDEAAPDETLALYNDSTGAKLKSQTVTLNQSTGCKVDENGNFADNAVGLIPQGFQTYYNVYPVPLLFTLSQTKTYSVSIDGNQYTLSTFYQTVKETAVPNGNGGLTYSNLGIGQE